MRAHGKPGIYDQLLIAADSFKGTFTSIEVGDALARGARGAGTPAVVLPVADGGEGSLAALSAPLQLQLHGALASDPLRRPVNTEFGLGANGVAVVECAAASGLNLVAAHERDAVAASSYGTGELIAAALQAGARHVYVAAGGSGTTDGGEGAIAAITELAPDAAAAAKFTVLCDVRTTFENAAAVFAPQKGADPGQVLLLNARLARQAEGYRRDPRGVPMTGAAGGLAGGLWAQYGAELVAGAPFVLNAAGYDTQMRSALAVITGEGRLDRQSLLGKVISEVATRARQAGVPCHAVVGSSQLDAFDARILDLQLIVEASTLAEIEDAGATIASAIAAQRARGH